MNSEQKQALEFGVPLRETCVKMEWQKETFFFWVKDVTSTIEEIWDVCYLDVQSDSYKTANNNKSLLSTDDEEYKPEYIVPAPQMHEIVPLIEKKQGFAGVEIIGSYLCFVSYKFKIENHHYAQAYAELWLKLKSEGLIGQNYGI